MTPARRKLWAAGVLLAAGVTAVWVGTRVAAPDTGAPSYRRWGPARARVVIAEYSDFECPRCAVAHPILKTLREKHADDVRLEFRHMPLRQHRWSAQAARAAEAAGRQDKFWEYADLLYAHQAMWSAADDAVPLFLGYAGQLGLDGDRFETDFNSDDVRDTVTREKALADAVPVHATPTFFINQRMLVGDSQLAAHGERYIRQELTR